MGWTPFTRPVTESRKSKWDATNLKTIIHQTCQWDIEVYPNALHVSLSLQRIDRQMDQNGSRPFFSLPLSLKTGSYGSSSGWQVGGNLCWHCVLRLGAIYLWTQFSQNLSRRSPILQRTERANGPIHPLALGAQMSSGHGSRTLANFGKEKEYLGLTGCSQSESLQWNCSLSPRVCIVVSL